MTTCTYKFKDASGEEVTITGQADMKAFLANGGLEQLLPGKVLPWRSAEAARKTQIDKEYAHLPEGNRPPAFRYGEGLEPWQIDSAEFSKQRNGNPHFDQSGFRTDGDYLRASNNAHKKLVAQAVAEGKPVPASVLAEYPDLKQSKGEPTAPAESPAVEPAEDRILTIDDIDTLVAGLNDGTVSADAYKAAWQAFQKSADTIKAGLHKLTKPQLLDKVGGILAYRMKGENKPDIVNAVFDAARNVFSLGRDYGPQGYFMGEYEEYKEAQKKAFADMIDATTDEDLKAYADKIAEANAERRQAANALEKAIQNPQTLDDFRKYVTAKLRQGMSESEVRMSLTPEQRAKMDDLHAEDTRKGRASRPAPAVTAASVTTGGDIVATKHTKTGEDLYVVRPAERVERDQYSIWNSTAKRMGGWYSSFRGNGAVPGFQFKTRESADAFLAYIGGDTEGAKQVAQERRDAFSDDRSQSAVERLTEMADRLEDRADESLSRDRKANTARRASMAASAEASANADKAMSRTMRNIANAIKDGKAKFLDKVRQKVQVEMLASFVRDAKYSELTKRYPSYADFERNRYEKPTSETADYAAFPKYTADRADLARMGREMELVEGSKKMGQRLLKVADDATDEYLKFVKANLNKVSTFRLKDGSPAIYSSRDDAESAIARSGFRGKAMVFSVKRGQNLVVMGPAMAKENGLWTADTGKRITLTDEAGEEITAKAESMNRNREKVYLPHQFSATRERRAKLKAMGIESAAEFRAALREFVALSEAPERPSRVKELERAMVGRRNDGLDFFPTPSGVAQQMIEAAGIEEGMSVLEPSAGMGHIAEQIRETGVDPDVVEFSSSRRELLEAKGFNVVANDFMEASGEYDRIVMNPPFSGRRDAEHVRHAFDLLKPGGRIVAIMGEGVFFGQDKKAESFREWLDSVGGSSEKLPDGTFIDPSLPVNTGVNSRLVVIDRPLGDASSAQGVALYEIDKNGDPSPEEAEAVQRGLEGKNPIEAAAWLAENAPMKFAVIAEKVRDKLQSLNDAGVRLGMAIIRAGDIGESALIGARGVTSPSFANGRQSISVAINGADMKGRVGTSYRTALHELVHAATLQPLDQGRKGHEKYAEAYRDLDDVGHAVVAHLNERIKSPESLTEFERALSLGRANFLDSPFEVIAWALSSHDAQAYLESIPYKSKSLWTAFVEAVRKVLGLKPGADTALSEVLRISDILLKPEREGWPGRVPLPGDSHYEIQQPGGGRIFKNPGGRPETNWADAPAVLRDTSALRDGESIPRDQAEAFIRSFVAEFPGAPPIMLADSFSQLPKELQAYAISQGSSARRAKGALKDGKAFVVLNNHHSMADLEATVFHEILGHTGIRKLLGPQFSQELNKLFVGLGGYSGLERIMEARGMGHQFEGYFRGIQQARASNPDAWTDALVKSILTEEVFAHIAEQKNAKQLRDRFMALVGMVRDWLRRHGFMDLASLGESDIVFMLQHAREGLRDGSGIVRDGATVGENEIVGEDGRPIAKEGSPDYEALKLLSGRLGLRERSGPTVFKDGLQDDENQGQDAGMDDAKNVAGKKAPNPAGDVEQGGAKNEAVAAFNSWLSAAKTVYKAGVAEGVGAIADVSSLDDNSLPVGGRASAILAYLKASGWRVTKGDSAFGIDTEDSHYILASKELGKADDGTGDLEPYYADDIEIRIANHGNTTISRRSGPVINLAPGEDTFSEAVRMLGSVRVSDTEEIEGGRYYSRDDLTFEQSASARPDVAVFRTDTSPSGKAADDVFLRTINTAGGRKTVRDHVAEAFSNITGESAKTFNWWQRTVGSQYGKAKSDKDFGRVYDAAHAFLDGVSAFAKEASERASGILPHLDTWRDVSAGLNVKKQWADSQDYQAIAPAIFDGTLANGTTGKVWTDEQLRDKYSLNDKQIGHYREFRAAVDFSLETLAASEMARLARASKMEVADRDMGMPDALAFYTDQLQGKIDAIQQAREDAELRHSVERENMADLLASIPNEKTRAESLRLMEERQAEEMAKLDKASKPLEELQGSFNDKSRQIRKLQSEGYAPLMRFGQYTVDVARLDDEGRPLLDEDGNPDRPFFGMFESESEARKAEKILTEEYPGYSVTRGVLSTEANQLYRGLTPETAEMFARLLGTDENEAFQAYLKQAVANRSAMKRLINRMGIEGFATDVPRVLSAFITSNARLSSGNWYFGEMSKAVEAIPKHKGDVKTDAVKLMQYVQNPVEEAAGLRGFLFFSFLGGSVASAVVNLTQTFTTTLPYLSQFGVGDVAKALPKAMALSGRMMKKGLDAVSDKDLKDALRKASDEGVVDPQEIHLLMAEASGNGASVGLSGLAGAINKEWATPAARVTRSLTQAWGMLFGAAEKYNRHVAFIAAWEVAPEGVDRYEFAKNAVTETQFDYTKASRPNWARGAVGATLFTFKTFSINYVEFMSRLPPRERAIALGVLFLLAGMSGMPGADDLDDVVDTVAQKMGYNWNNTAARHAWLVRTLGTGGADFVERGVSSMLPLDVSARLGMGNLVPGTGVLQKSNTSPVRDVQEFFGPAGSVVAGFRDVFDNAGSGKGVIDTALPLMPKMFKDLRQAVDMVQTGQYRDMKGRKVVDVDGVDAVLKGIGFQPNSVASPRRVERMLAQSAGMQRVIRQDISELWARGVAEQDAEKVASARTILREWNEKNPESKITMNPTSIAQRVRAMRLTSADRLVKATPKDMRGALAAEMAVQH